MVHSLTPEIKNRLSGRCRRFPKFDRLPGQNSKCLPNTIVKGLPFIHCQTNISTHNYVIVIGRHFHSTTTSKFGRRVAHMAVLRDLPVLQNRQSKYPHSVGQQTAPCGNDPCHSRAKNSPVTQVALTLAESQFKKVLVGEANKDF